MMTSDAKSPKAIHSTIDIAKFIMALLVVGIHTEPFGFNVWLDRGFGILTRHCVPFFFVASSYLYWSRKPQPPAARYILRMLILYLVWSVLYLPLDLKGMASWTFLDFADTFLWSGYRHMWYISCSVIGFLIVYLLGKKLRSRTILAISLVFLLIGCCKSTWAPLVSRLFGISVSDVLGSRNGLFYAFPYMALGKYIAGHKPAGKRSLICLKLGASVALLIAESYLFVVRYQTKVTILWMSVFLTTCYLFQLLLSFHVRVRKETSVRLRNLSTLIYFIHMYFIYLFSPALRNIPLYLAVSVSSVAASYLIIRLSEIRQLRFLKYLY